MPRDIVSEQQCNIEFVKTIEKYPCLYNYLLPTYSKKDITDKAWEEVAEASNMTPSACKDKWRNFRTVLMRTKKQAESGIKKRPYYLAEVMEFMLPFMQATYMTEAEKQRMLEMEAARCSTSGSKEFGPPSVEVELEEVKIENTYDDSNQEWSTENVNSSRKRPQDFEEYYPTSGKRPPAILQPSSSVATPEYSDPVASFVDSLMPELREMDSAQFKCFKRRVLVLIDDITEEIPSM